jgi:spore germination protein GerM
MVEPTGHCPYLGLKQNRAIRFSSPTPEHRCYVGGEPIEIPVDQASYCLSRGHVNCPLYMGLTVPTTAAAIGGAAQAVPAAGMRSWLTSLPPRDRAIYALMIGMLALIVLIYLAAGLQSFGQPLGVLPTAAPTGVATPGGGAVIGETPTAQMLNPTSEPTSTSAPPSNTPEAPTSSPEAPTSTSEAPTTPPTETRAVVMPTAEATPSFTPAPATARPTRAPAEPTATARTAEPTRTPPANVSTETLWLYFGDESGSLYVPVQRTVQVQDRRVAEAAVRELIRGPRGALSRLVVPDAQLLDLTIRDDTAFVNFDRLPSGAGDDRGLFSIVLSLTHFSTVRQVQILVNGQPIDFNRGQPVIRPVVNPLNPDRLAFNFDTTEFLPLYFPTAEGSHDVRIIRMVPKTRETAAATVRALIEGPGEYGPFVQEVIPDGAELLGVRLEGGVAMVNLSAPFAEAGNRDAAVRTIVESLTALPSIEGVRFEVGGRPLGELWGERYGRVFPKPPINPE